VKIVHLVHNFPPEFTGGTELYVAHVARTQASLGHEVVVVAGTDERDWECRPVEHGWEGLRVIRMRRFPRPLVLVTEGYDPLLLKALRQVLEAERPDVLHAHHWLNLSTSCVVLAAEMGIPAALSFHDLFAVCPRFFRYRSDGRCTRATSLQPCAFCCDEDYPFPAWERARDFELRAAEIQRDADTARKHLFPSQAHADYLTPLLASRPEQVEVIPHGVLPIEVEVAPRPPLPPAFSSERPLRLGYWGNLVRAKGVSDLLEVVARLTGKGLEITLDLWGKPLEPDLEEECRRACSRIPVTCHGEFSRDAFREIGSGVDLACFVSALQESYSFTVDEAAHLRIPVVVSDRGAPKERVGGGGRVVPAEDPEALTSAIETLYRHPEALEAMAGAAPAPPPVSVAGERLLAIYETIQAAGAVPPPPPDSRPRLEHWYMRLCARENWLHDLVQQKNRDSEKGDS